MRRCTRLGSSGFERSDYDERGGGCIDMSA